MPKFVGTPAKPIQHLSIINRRDEWETPPNLFELACMVYRITPNLDVCATKNSKLCNLYFGPDHKNPARRNALKVSWDKDFFMNPPYTQVAEFMDYAFAQVREHRVSALILTYSKTDTRWWHKYIENNPLVKTHFVRGRIRFLLNGVLPVTCANKKCRTFYTEDIKKCRKCSGVKSGVKFLKNTSPYPSVWLVVNPKRRKK